MDMPEELTSMMKANDDLIQDVHKQVHVLQTKVEVLLKRNEQLNNENEALRAQIEVLEKIS